MRPEIIQRLDRVAALLRRLGLSSLTHAGRDFLNRFSGHFLVVERDGLRIEGSMESRGDIYLLAEGKYESFTTQLFKSLIAPGMTVLDLGSQIGWFALVAAQRVGPTGRVCAFEPDPRNLKILRANVRVNKFEGIVQVVPKAISDTTGTTTFHVSRSSRSSSIDFRPRRELEQKISIETTSVDDFLGSAPVNVIKMDIEGAEPRALLAMERTLRSNPSLQMIVEMNASSLHSSGSAPDELLLRLRERFGRVEAIDEKQGHLTSAEDFVARNGAEAIYNLLCRDPKAFVLPG
jgi:FkbM family methyltransferase